MLRRSNCLFFAVALWWRRYKKGQPGYVSARKSMWGWFPHFLYEEYGRKVSFVPIDPRRKMFPPPLFRGRVRRGDLHYEAAAKARKRRFKAA